MEYSDDKNMVLRKCAVPKFNAPENFNLDNYMEKNRSAEKIRAQLWGAGDFRALVKYNMEARR